MKHKTPQMLQHLRGFYSIIFYFPYFLASAAAACPDNPSPCAIRDTSGAIRADASGVMLWWVQVFKNVPTQTPPV